MMLPFLVELLYIKVCGLGVHVHHFVLSFVYIKNAQQMAYKNKKQTQLFNSDTCCFCIIFASISIAYNGQKSFVVHKCNPT